MYIYCEYTKFIGKEYIWWTIFGIATSLSFLYINIPYINWCYNFFFTEQNKNVVVIFVSTPLQTMHVIHVNKVRKAESVVDGREGLSRPAGTDDVPLHNKVHQHQ